MKETIISGKALLSDEDLGPESEDEILPEFVSSSIDILLAEDREPKEEEKEWDKVDTNAIRKLETQLYPEKVKADEASKKILTDMTDRNTAFLKDDSKDSLFLKDLKRKRSESYENIQRMRENLSNPPQLGEGAKSLLSSTTIGSEEKKEEPEVIWIPEDGPYKRMRLDVANKKTLELSGPEETPWERHIWFGKKYFGYGSVVFSTMSVFFIVLLVLNFTGNCEGNGLEDLSNFFEVRGLLHPKGTMILVTLLSGYLSYYSLLNYFRVLDKEKAGLSSLVSNRADENVRMMGGALSMNLNVPELQLEVELALAGPEDEGNQNREEIERQMNITFS